MSKCLFCQIANKELKAFILLENENFLSFLDIKPHSPGHSLIIPKKHLVSFTDLSEELYQDLIRIIKEAIFKISKKLKTSDFTIGINEGKLAGRLIDHLHFHVIPRFPNDNGGSIHSVVYNPPSQSVEEIYNLLKDEN
ncbi:MAG: HIT family protein [Patescibacteria group bacterium]|nr:HIT family protein [Patescibacteria group bacterium]